MFTSTRKKENKMIVYIIVAIVAYLIGSVNFSILISKKMAGFDVREKGSNNAGTTNVLRTVGKKAAAITLICDILKGVVAVLLAILIAKISSKNAALLAQIAAIEVVIGHTYPVFFGFKGGKGVATSLGIILVLNWKIGLICLAYALVIMIMTRTVSLGSILTAILFPILALPLQDGFIVEGNYFVFAIILACIVVFNHRSNIKRINAGTENRISFKKKDKTEGNKEESKEESKEDKKEDKKEVKTKEEK